MEDVKEINQKIEELLDRGVSAIYPNRAFLENLLKSGKRLTIYLGIDPTGPTLHLGHAIQLRKLSEFQSLGHKIILLIGDFTATIGDPTGKFSTRKLLTKKEVLSNAKLYKKQASKWLSFGGGNKAEIKYNSKWLAKMNLEQYIKLSTNITVDQLLERDMFKRRREEGKPIFLHEFYYPLLQGYDSVALSVDGEIGGNDQTFNMLTGRDLTKILIGKDKFVLTTKLLEDNSGNKMGKTEGNMVALSDDPNEMFGKIMSWGDNLIMPGFELCTKLSLEGVSKLKNNLEKGVNPRDVKMTLGEEIVKVYYGEDKAKEASLNFTKTFSQKAPEFFEIIKTHSGEMLSLILLNQKIVQSKSDFYRLVEGGGVEDLTTNQKITDPKMIVVESKKIRVGKKRFLDIQI